MAPKEGHLKAMRQVFGYLKQYPHGKIIVNTTKPYHTIFHSEDYHSWNEFYPDAQEEIPHDLIEPKGKSTRLTVYVDADHAHDLVTRRSVTGIIAMINNTPIRWVCK